MIIGTGIDIIETYRIQEAVERWGDQFVNHVFTEAEIKYSRQHKFPAQHFAARFAAKEAVFKAVGDPLLSWKHIEILNDPTGRPVCTIKKGNFPHRIIISISHTKNYAVANAIVTDDQERP
jgi:holo-[acyl-carrier protein] synthase